MAGLFLGGIRFLVLSGEEDGGLAFKGKFRDKTSLVFSSSSKLTYLAPPLNFSGSCERL